MFRDRERGRIFSLTGSVAIGDVGDFSAPGDGGLCEKRDDPSNYIGRHMKVFLNHLVWYD